MGNHESINRIEQNKEQGAQCVNKHIKMIPSQGGRNHYHPPPAREGFGMLMTCCKDFPLPAEASQIPEGEWVGKGNTRERVWF